MPLKVGWPVWGPVFHKGEQLELIIFFHKEGKISESAFFTLFSAQPHHFGNSPLCNNYNLLHFSPPLIITNKLG